MKNTQNGFVVTLLVAIIALLVIGGGVYIFEQNKSPQTAQQQTISDQTVSTSTSIGQNIQAPKVDSFSVLPTSGTAPLTAKFTNTIQSSGDTSIDYGDGTSCSTANPDGSQNCSLYSHTYATAGTYTAILYRHLPTTELARTTITVSRKDVISTVSVPGMKQYTDSNFGFSIWYPTGSQVQKTGQSIIVGAHDNSNLGVTIQEFSSADKSVTDNSSCGPADGCPSSIRYYFDSSSHTWMIEMYNQYPGGSLSPIIKAADVSKNTMGGLHILQGNARFGDNVIVPLSAKNFLVIHSNVAGGGPDYKLIVNTIVATDPSVATPVSVTQQVQTVQAEAAAFGIKDVNLQIPSITILSPNGGETLKVGQPTTITWNTTGFSSSDTVYISLYDSSKYCPPNSVGCWTAFMVGDYGLKNTGSYTWDTNTYFGDPGPGVPFYLSQKVSAGAVYKISLVIVGSNGARATDSSNNYFTVTAQ